MIFRKFLVKLYVFPKFEQKNDFYKMFEIYILRKIFEIFLDLSYNKLLIS